MRAWMRKREYRVIAHDLVIGDEINVEGARTPTQLARATGATFYGLCALKELFGGELRVENEHSVRELGLRNRAPGLSTVH